MPEIASPNSNTNRDSTCRVGRLERLAGHRQASQWLATFDKARAFVQRLGLKSETEWRAYCRSGKRPDDIPSSPETVYADAGWAGWRDWLGTGKRRNGWRPFNKARAFVRSLGLKSASDWRAYCGSGKKPDDIPSNPHKTYADAGWDGWSDWLGSGGGRRGNWRPFNKTRAFVRSLGLESGDDWKTYCRSGKKPNDIPAVPNKAYAEHWVGWNDWLGRTA